MKEFSLIIHLLSNANNPNIPPEAIWFPTREACEARRALVLKYRTARQVECVHWSERNFTIAH
jgi:hypothetical protein